MEAVFIVLHLYDRRLLIIFCWSKSNVLFSKWENYKIGIFTRTYFIILRSLFILQILFRLFLLCSFLFDCCQSTPVVYVITSLIPNDTKIVLFRKNNYFNLCTLIFFSVWQTMNSYVYLLRFTNTSSLCFRDNIAKVNVTITTDDFILTNQSRLFARKYLD